MYETHEIEKIRAAFDCANITDDDIEGEIWESGTECVDYIISVKKAIQEAPNAFAKGHAPSSLKQVCAFMRATYMNKCKAADFARDLIGRNSDLDVDDIWDQEDGDTILIVYDKGGDKNIFDLGGWHG